MARSKPADDPPAVAVTAEARDITEALLALKWGGRIAAIVGPLLLTGGGYLLSQVNDLKVQIGELKTQLHSHLEQHNGRAGTEGLPQPMPSPSGAAPDPVATASAPPAPVASTPRRQPRSDGGWSGYLADHLEPRIVCADPNTGARLNCEHVAGCYDDAAFTPDHRKQIADALHVGAVKLCKP